MEEKETTLAEYMDELAVTPQEYSAVASRWALVRLLDSGMTQRKISETLGLSLCKITRGSKEMKKEQSSFRKMIDIYKNL